MSAAKRFQTINPTLPNADDQDKPKEKIKTSRRPDVQTSKAPVPPPGKGTSAFTWRMTPETLLQVDGLILRLRAESGRARLDKVTVMQALVDLADESPAIFGALIAKLTEDV